MAPDLPVADEPKEATRGSPTVEKSVRIEVKKDGEDLAIGEAFQSRRVVSFETAVVRLSQFVRKVIQGKMCKLPYLSSLLCHPFRRQELTIFLS